MIYILYHEQDEETGELNPVVDCAWSTGIVTDHGKRQQVRLCGSDEVLQMRHQDIFERYADATAALVKTLQEKQAAIRREIAEKQLEHDRIQVCIDAL